MEADGSQDSLVLPAPEAPLSLEEVYARLASLAQRSEDRPGKSTKCPEVGAILAMRNGRGSFSLIAERAHGYSVDRSACTHAEEEAIRFCIGQGISLSGAVLFTTLEPCTERSNFRTPCTHLIDAVGVREVHVGLLDLDPEIYGRAAVHLSRVNAKVDYLPRVHRTSLAHRNKDFLQRKRGAFDWRSLERQMPFVVSKELDESAYLRTMHALFTLFDSGDVFWLDPRLPSLNEKDRFQAVWAQGILNNRETKVHLFVESAALDEALRKLLQEDWAHSAMSELMEATHVQVGLLEGGEKRYRGVVLRRNALAKAIFVSATPISAGAHTVEALVVARQEQMGSLGESVLEDIQMLSGRLKGSILALPVAVQQAAHRNQP